MKQSLLLTTLVALMALLSAPSFGQDSLFVETELVGADPDTTLWFGPFDAGRSTLSAFSFAGYLFREVKLAVVTGYYDSLGWRDRSSVRWKAADDSVGVNRAIFIGERISPYLPADARIKIGLTRLGKQRVVRVDFYFAKRVGVFVPPPPVDTCCEKIADLAGQQKKMRGQLDSLLALPKQKNGDTTLVFNSPNLSLEVAGGVGYVFSRRISNTVPMATAHLFFTNNSFYLYGGIGESGRFNHPIGGPVREKLSRFGIGYKHQFPKNHFSCRERGDGRLHKNDVAIAVEFGRLETSEELLVHRTDLGLIAGELETLTGYELSARLELFHLFTGGAGIIYGDYDKVFAGPEFDQWTYSMYGGINPLTAGQYISVVAKKLYNLIF